MQHATVVSAVGRADLNVGSTANWSDLRLRLISAAVIVPVALCCIWAGGPVFDVMVTLVTVGMVTEVLTLTGTSRGALSLWRYLLVLAWPVVGLAAALRGEWQAAFGVIGVAFIFGPALWAGLATVILGGLSLLWLRHLPVFGLVSVLYVILVVVMSDSGAYLTGRIFGGPKLAPRISPGKTRSGALGGLVFAALAGSVAAYCVSPAGWLGGLIYGGVLSMAAQSGDLAESAAKRRVGVKDSGALIPGHGGLLDRFDALLAVAPVAAILSLASSGKPFWMATPHDWVSALLGGIHVG